MIAWINSTRMLGSSETKRAEKTTRNERRPLPYDLMNCVFDFLPKKTLCAVELVNRFWKESTDPVWKAQAIKHRFLDISRAISHKKYVSDLYKFGAEGWWKAFQIDIGAISNIPDDLLAKRAELDPWDKTRTIGETHECLYLPDLTLHHIGVLFTKRFSCRSPFNDEYSWGAVLAQHENDPVVAPGWRLLRKEVVEKSYSISSKKGWLDSSTLYTSQKAAVGNHEDWVIVSLIERACLNLLMRITLPSHPQLDSHSWARTSTETLTKSGYVWPTAVLWINSGNDPEEPSSRLIFRGPGFDPWSGRGTIGGFFSRIVFNTSVGVAVGIRPGSS
jgi:hypothetical protein